MRLSPQPDKAWAGRGEAEEHNMKTTPDFRIRYALRAESQRGSRRERSGHPVRD
jgi:hypothetical protein